MTNIKPILFAHFKSPDTVLKMLLIEAMAMDKFMIKEIRFWT
jgi:hypothetical protein